MTRLVAPLPDTIGDAAILSKRQVCLLIGVTEKTLDRWMSLGWFPEPVHNGARFPKWSYASVAGFLRARGAQAVGHA
jgi:predicted DNA-binding transcriptional regulator AlpA